MRDQPGPLASPMVAGIVSGVFRACFIFLGITCAAAAQPAATFADPVTAGELRAPPKLETSGLAASRRDPGVLWTHDDSGGAAALYAIRTTGEKIGTLQISGVKNEDWEDLASYELAGKSWLLIADTGDNDAKRKTVQIHIVEEPERAVLERSGALAERPRTLRLRYEDGPRDCESVAVDVQERAVYLLTKRETVKRLYRVELEPKDANAVAIARQVGLVSNLPQPTTQQSGIKGYLGRRRAETTAMDILADGSAALVLTYGDLLLFPRRGTEPWAEAFARVPDHLPPPLLLQVEAACFSSDGRHIFVAAEGSRTLLRYDRR